MNPDLGAHYAAMRQAALPRLALGHPELDTLLDHPAADTRRGLTLLARPPQPLVAALAARMAELAALEPAQYYYPPSDIHLTILSIISCYPGFQLADIEPAAYARLVAELLRHVPPLRIRFAGFTASAAGIMVQGFPLDEGLGELRQQLRVAFQASGLPQSIDQRYRIQTAHATLVRFRAPLRHPARLVAWLRRHAQVPIGDFELGTIELVFNDWYQRAAHTVLLQRNALVA
ncbi:mutarotase [Hymenobacter sp. RP-2-7]|uniref:Mutarotase n=1 Tax=Hymenobacter polaris TaxID=2682546 RepID=A0A7Y0AB29_9BACT|nr:mutarotase [Hymenobacter polaris]NML64057.1 mutarotase [Hymenobacter polaris]